jgi:hypothetical protein
MGPGGPWAPVCPLCGCLRLRRACAGKSMDQAEQDRHGPAVAMTYAVCICEVHTGSYQVSIPTGVHTYITYLSRVAGRSLSRPSSVRKKTTPTIIIDNKLA